MGIKCNAQLGEIVSQGAFLFNFFFQAIFQFLSNLGMKLMQGIKKKNDSSKRPMKKKFTQLCIEIISQTID